MEQQQEATPRERSASKVLAQVVAWPLMTFTAPPTAFFTYLAIASGPGKLQQELADNPFNNILVFFLLAQIVSLTLIGAASGFRSTIFKVGIVVSVIMIAFVGIAASIAFSGPR